MIGNHLEPFKFWCQKVLPNVYDDSLSYYEYLCKLNEYLNEVIGQINTLTDNMEDYESDLSAQWNDYKEALNAEWTETKNYIDNYFNNLNVQQEINNKLDAMAQSGELSTLLAPIVGTQIGGVVAEQIGGTVANQIGPVVANQIGPVVASQIDEPTATATSAWLTAHVDPVGSAVIVDDTLTIDGAAADAEKTGLMVATVYDNTKTYNEGEYINYNGSIYKCIIPITVAENWTPSHWSKINIANEITETKYTINELRNEQLAYFVIKNQYVSNSNGSFAYYDGWNRTDFIPVDNLYSISPSMSVSSSYNVFYNSSKEFISSFYIGTTAQERVIPNNAKYLIISNTAEGLDSLKCTYITNKEHTNDNEHNALEDEQDYLEDYAIKARDITSFVTNNSVYFDEKNTVEYYSGDTFRQKTFVNDMTPYIENGKDYILYCGGINVPSPTGVIRLYVEYTDSSFGYVDVNEKTRFKHFKLDGSKVISTLQLRGVAINGGTALSTNGTAIFSNIYVLEGETLILRDIFGNNDIWTRVPLYYNSQLATKNATIRGHKKDCAFNGDSLIFITDTHYKSNYFINKDISDNTYNANHSIPLINNIIENTGVRMIFFGGDLVHTTTNIDSMIHSMNIFGSTFGDSKTRLAYCVGNHEYFTDNGQGSQYQPSADWLYGGFIKYNEERIGGKTDMDTYYFDNPIQKIRYFVIGCSANTGSSNTQIAWLLDEFTKIPNGYKIICIGHSFISDTMDSFRGNYAKVMEALDAVNSGTTCTFNNVTYDYSSLTSVEAVCVLTGHTHIDGYLNSTGGIPCICTTCDSYAQNYEIQEGVPVNVPRSINTVNEQAFDVVQFDFTGKKIYCTRIGYGSDRVFSY